MVVMLVAFIAVVVVVAGAVVAKLTWRPSNDEVHSVNDYHSALGTIGDLARQNPPPGTSASGQSSDREHVRPDPGTPLVFDDRSTGRTQRAATSEADPLFRSDRARRQALSSMNHRPRRWVLTTAIVVVLLAFGALAYVGSHLNAKPTTNKKNSPPVTHATTAVHTTPSRPSTHTPKTKPKTKPKTTTPPTTPSQIAALSTTDTTATYPAPSSSYQVVVTTTTGPVWVLAQSTDSGNTLWTGTIQTGQSQTIPGNGGMSLELGATGATVTLNGTPVALPNPLNVPFEATFTSSSTATSTTTTGASTSTTAPSSTANTG
jgi:hypothetical protein